MPKPIYKAQPHDELYVEWTTVADGPCNILTRDDIDRPDFHLSRFTREEWHERLDRADVNGTSEMWRPRPAWNAVHTVQHIYGDNSQYGRIRHCDLLDYALLCFCGAHEEAWDLFCTSIDEVT